VVSAEGQQLHDSCSGVCRADQDALSPVYGLQMHAGVGEDKFDNAMATILFQVCGAGRVVAGRGGGPIQWLQLAVRRCNWGPPLPAREPPSCSDRCVGLLRVDEGLWGWVPSNGGPWLHTDGTVHCCVCGTSMELNSAAAAAAAAAAAGNQSTDKSRQGWRRHWLAGSLER
jgi:hypothetical protein